VNRIFIYMLIFFPLSLSGFAQEEEALEMPVGQRIQDFYFSNYKEDGTCDWEIEGIEAVIYDEIIEIDYMKGKYYSGAKNVTVTSDKAFIDKLTFNIRLEHNVKIVSDDVEFQSDILNWDKTDNKVYTDEKVYAKKGEIDIDAIGFRADIDIKTGCFFKDVVLNIPDDHGKGEMRVDCDGPLDIDYIKEEAVFNNNVIASGDKSKLYGDKVTVFFDTKEKIIEKVLAQENVRIERGGSVTNAKEAVYMAKEGKTILSGRPEINYDPKNKDF